MCVCGVLYQQGKKELLRGKVLQNIKTIPYGNLLFSEGRDCPVCLATFEPNE